MTIWAGQFASLFGSGMTSFALTIWIFKQTGSPAALALTAFFMTAPMLVFGPISGALTDRFSRKMLLIVSDSLAGLATLVLFLIFKTGHLEIWHIYIAVIIAGIADSIQIPIFMGSITLMVPKEQYGRASGLHGLASTASSIFAPVAAAGLLIFSDIGVILWVDLATFGLAIMTLSITCIPQPAETEVGNNAKGNFFQDITYGFKYILARPSLRGLQAIWMFANFLAAMGNVLIPALVLAKTGGDNFALSGVEAVLSAGAVIGGILISTWGGPKKKVQGAMLSMALSAILGRILFGLGGTFITWLPGAFFIFFFVPILNGCLAPIWLSKVPPDVQGRVMSARITLSRSMGPLGSLVAGPLAEHIFEPVMNQGGKLVPIFGKITGSGPGAGMSLLLVFTGVFMLMLTPIGLLTPAIRDAEKLLPDIEASALQD